MDGIELKLSHVAFAVNNIDNYKEKLKKVFEIDNSDDKREYGNFAMISQMIGFADTEFECMEPLGNGMIKQFLEKNKEGFHHLAFRCNNLEKYAGILENRGVKLIKDDSGKLDFFFIHPKETGGLLIEVHI